MKVRGTEQVISASVTDTQLDAPNANVGTFGDATHVAQVTVAASGRITAASNVAITASVGGSGTTGKIPKWATSTSLTDSVITESSSNIGIGTASPSVQLDITKSFRAQAGAVNVPASGTGIEIYCQSINTGSILVFDRTGIAYKPLQIDASLLELNAGSSGGVAIGTSSDPGSLNLGIAGKIARYANVATVGWGVPAIYGTGRVTAQTGNVTIASYTVGAADGSFLVSANALITASTSGLLAIAVSYTDESNTARTVDFNFSQAGGGLVVGLGPVGEYPGLPLHIRAKASTTISIASVGTYVLTYNAEGYITQIG